MAFSPVTVGEAFTLTGPLQLDNGAAMPNLQNASSAQLIFAPDDFSQPSTALRFAATGSVVITVSSATYSYTPSSLDLINLTAATWKVQCAVTYLGGGIRYSSIVHGFVVNAPN